MTSSILVCLMLAAAPAGDVAATPALTSTVAEPASDTPPLAAPDGAAAAAAAPAPAAAGPAAAGPAAAGPAAAGPAAADPAAADPAAADPAAAAGAPPASEAAAAQPGPASAPPAATATMAAPPATTPVADGPGVLQQPQPASPASGAQALIPAPRVKRCKLAVFDFALAGDAAPQLARALSDVAAAEAGKSSGCQVISQAEIAAIIGLDRSKQLMGCTDDGCLVELAGAMEVDRLLSGQLTKIEHTSLLVIRLLDARKAKTLARVNSSVKDASEAELLDASRRLTYEALTGKPLDTTGTVRVRVSENGAQVLFDGKDLGRSPLAGTTRAFEGRHTITIQKPGFVTWSSTLTVVPGSELPVEVQLVPLPASANQTLKTWGYVSGGAALAVAGVATVLGMLATDAYEDYRNAGVRSEAVRLHTKTSDLARFANIGFVTGGVLALGSGSLLSFAYVNDARAERGSAP